MNFPFKLPFQKKEVTSSFDEAAPTSLGPNLKFAAIEAYTLLRTNLLYTLPQKESAHIVCVTSASPSEGKSFTTINMAYAFAKNGSHVLLMDCDLRKPVISKNLKVDSTPGITDVLTGQSTFDDSVRHGLLHEGLDVLTAGGYPPNPSELLGSKQMKDLLEVVSTKYDIIFVDLPPVNSVSDPLILAGESDGIVLVVRHTFSHKKEVLRAVKQIQFVGIPLLGFLYNGRHLEGHYYRKRYKKYYSHYGYGYGEHSKEKEESAT